MSRILAMQQLADRLASPEMNLGYDQGQRGTFYDVPTRTFIPGMEGDCSSVCGAIAHAAGYPVNLAAPFWTGNFADRMKQAGFSLVDVKGWDRARLFGEVRGGDFLLGPGHVVFCRDRDRWLSAEKDENGRPYGGRSGDQTGEEVLWRNPYMRSRGWEWIVRPPAETATTVLASTWTHRVGTWLTTPLNVRSSAPTASGLGPVKTTVAPGARLRLLGPVKAAADGAWWAEVKFEGQTGTVGWVNVNYVQPIRTGVSL